MNLEDVRQRCFINEETGCWEWRGALSDGKWPRIHAPNLSIEGGKFMVQTGRRAVWQLSTGKAIPKGYRVYGTCQCNLCLNPGHMKCGTTAELGRLSQRMGRFKNSPRRIAANRKIGRERSVFTPEILAELQLTTETSTAIAKRMGVAVQTISKARNGRVRSFHSANPFAGLMA